MRTNTVLLVGYVGNHLKSCKSVRGEIRAGISVATHYSYGSAEGEFKQTTTWHDVVAWRKLGETALRSFVKGSRIMVEGYLIYREFKTRDGKRFFKTFITATSLINLDR